MLVKALGGAAQVEVGGLVEAEAVERLVFGEAEGNLPAPRLAVFALDVSADVFALAVHGRDFRDGGGIGEGLDHVHAFERAGMRGVFGEERFAVGVEIRNRLGGAVDADDELGGAQLDGVGGFLDADAAGNFGDLDADEAGRRGPAGVLGGAHAGDAVRDEFNLESTFGEPERCAAGVGLHLLDRGGQSDGRGAH